VLLAVELTVSVEMLVPPLVKVTLVGLRDGVRPVGETVAERETVPLKLLRLVIETEEVPGEPAWTVTLVGLADTPKFAGLEGLIRANLMLVGEDVPWAYTTSRFGLVPVALMFRASLFVAESSRVSVEAQEPPTGCLM